MRTARGCLGSSPRPLPERRLARRAETPVDAGGFSWWELLLEWR